MRCVAAGRLSISEIDFSDLRGQIAVAVHRLLKDPDRAG